MKLKYKRPHPFPYWGFIALNKGRGARHTLTKAGIVASFDENSVLPYRNHIEMAGLQMSCIFSYKINKNRQADFNRFCVFPSLRINPNDTGGSLRHTFSDVKLSINGQKEKIDAVSFDGVLSFYCALGSTGVTRRVLPCYSKKALLEEITINTDKPLKLKLSCIRPNHTVRSVFTPGEEDYKLRTTVYFAAAAVSPKNAVLSLSKGENELYIAYGCESLTLKEIKEQIKLREKSIEESKNQLVITTPDEKINKMIQFTKLRASESIFETKNGLMHAPGGGNYYAALWTNDQCEYANPMFAYLGHAKANEQSINCYELYAKLAKEDEAIYTSIIAEGDDYWHGAGDRGDNSMFITGCCRYLLTRGDVKTAVDLLPALETAAAYVLSQMDENGVVHSDSDELENRFESGNANLSTACLSYDAFLMLHAVEKSLGYDKKAAEYSAVAEKIEAAIESYFGSEVEGYQTYRYCEEDDHLRSWICLPLTVGISKRKDATIDALLSSKLRTGNGIVTRSGEKTYWDRSTLYAIRGMFAIGESERGMDLLQSYTAERLLGEHVPYPVEAHPEGNGAHLSAESALYVRIFVEGVLGFTPTSFNSFSLKPSLPAQWGEVSFKNIDLCGGLASINVASKGDKYEINISYLDEPILVNKGEAVQIIV